MTIFALILTIMALVYILTGLIIHLGLRKKHPTRSVQPVISVLIAARNEEATLRACLNSMEKINYQEDKYEVIIIDDHSTDRTAGIAHSFCERLKNFRLLTITEERDGLAGKMNALAQAIDLAIGDIILITDADCRVGTDWLAGMAAGFTEKTVMTGGLTIIKSAADRPSLFDRIQALDLLFLQAIAAGTAGIGFPVSILGNNFGFRKDHYQLIGGFKEIGFSLTEDMVLMQRMTADGHGRLSYHLQEKTRIETNPLPDLTAFFRQRKRWLHGGIKNTLWGYFLMSTAFTAHIAVFFGLIAGAWMPSLWWLLLAVGLVDLSLVFRVYIYSGQKGMLRFFPVFEIFFSVYSLILVLGLFWPGKFYWKDKAYSGRS